MEGNEPHLCTSKAPWVSAVLTLRDKAVHCKGQRNPDRSAMGQ